MKQKRKKNGVVYTCLTAGYDRLINHKYVNNDWDYVCFTNNKSIQNKNNFSWKIRPLAFNKLDDVRNQRWHKIHPHVLLPEYKKSLYVDTSINILNANVFNDIERIIKINGKISLGPHFERKNIFDEFDVCQKLGKDDIDVMQKQRLLMKKSNFSGEFGVFFENSLIFRKHNDPDVIRIMEDWWWWVENYSRRDQLSLVYVLWKNNMKVPPLTNISYRNNSSIELICSENHITKEELLVQRVDFQREITNLNNSIKQKDQEIQTKDQEIQTKDQEIQTKDQEIQFIKSSKFWKLRGLYAGFKSSVLIRFPYKAAKIFFREGPTSLAKKIIKNLKKPNDLVSVIIPVYDRTWELKETIDSILNQTHKKFEIILVTDGSPKETIEIIKKYENNHKIRVFYYHDNSGNAVRGRNRGIKESKGKFIAFQDSDDVAEFTRLEKSLEFMTKYNADVVYGGWRAILDGTRTDTGLKDGQEIISSECNIETLKSSCVPCQSTAMVRKSALSEVGGLKTKMKYREDHELWLRLAHFGYKFKAIPEILTNLRIHKGNNELNFKDGDDFWFKLMMEEYKNKANDYEL